MAEASRASRRPPISVSLLSRSSLLGGAVVLGVALTYIIGVPAINDIYDGDNAFQPSNQYVIGDGYHITPEPGWDLEDADEPFVTVTKSGARMVFTPAVTATKSPGEAIGFTIAALESDSNNAWQVGQPQAFVTDDGATGIVFEAHSSQGAEATWVITDGSQSITMAATSPDDVWGSLAPEMEAMAQSATFAAVEPGA